MPTLFILVNKECMVKKLVKAVTFAVFNFCRMTDGVNWFSLMV